MDHSWYAKLALAAHCFWLSGLFSQEKECEKPRAACPKQFPQKKGEPRPIVKFRVLRSLQLLDSGKYGRCHIALNLPDFLPKEKECEKPRAAYPTNITKKKGELRPIFKCRILHSFHFQIVGITKCVILRVQETGSRPPGGLLEAQRSTCGSLLGSLEGLMGCWSAS